MERLERFYKIDRLLKERTSVPFEALQEALEVSPATLKRDLDYMRARFNAPIEWDRGTRGFRSGSRAPARATSCPGCGSAPRRRTRCSACSSCSPTCSRGCSSRT